MTLAWKIRYADSLSKNKIDLGIMEENTSKSLNSLVALLNKIANNQTAMQQPFTKIASSIAYAQS